MTQRFWIGQSVRIEVDFTAEDDVPVAATGVSIRAKSPADQVVVGQPVSGEQAGTYYCDFVMDQAGIWYVRASCDGPHAASVEDRIEIRASNVL